MTLFRTVHHASAISRAASGGGSNRRSVDATHRALKAARHKLLPHVEHTTNVDKGVSMEVPSELGTSDRPRTAHVANNAAKDNAAHNKQRSRRRGDPFQDDPLRQSACKLVFDSPPRASTCSSSASHGTGQAAATTTAIYWFQRRQLAWLLKRHRLKCAAAMGVLTAPFVFWCVVAHCLNPHSTLCDDDGNHHEASGELPSYPTRAYGVGVLRWFCCVLCNVLQNVWDVPLPPRLGDGECFDDVWSRRRRPIEATVVLESPRLPASWLWDVDDGNILKERRRLLTVDERVIVGAQVGGAASVITAGAVLISAWAL